jgi:hypothetical protein
VGSLSDERDNSCLPNCCKAYGTFNCVSYLNYYLGKEIAAGGGDVAQGLF